MGAYLALFFPKLLIAPVAVALAVVIGALNAYGAKLTGTFQTLLLVGLLAVLGLFIGVGVPAIEPSRFAGFSTRARSRSSPPPASSTSAMPAFLKRLNAQGRTLRAGAVYHLFERLGRQRHESLDRELRQIIKEKGLREHDPSDEVVAGAQVIDLDGKPSFETVVRQASGRLAEALGATPEEMLSKETELGMVPVSHGAALLHLRQHNLDAPRRA